MNMKILEGQYATADALHMIGQLFQWKIRYHEERIAPDASEEDIAMRERQISRLQHEWQQLRQALRGNGPVLELSLQAQVHQQ